MRLRTALACSYNIPAVRICELYGPDMLLATLKQLDFLSLDKSPVHYGLGLTLGNGEVSLMELTRAFAVFAHGGYYVPERLYPGSHDHATGTHQRRIFDAAVAYIISSILSIYPPTESVIVMNIKSFMCWFKGFFKDLFFYGITFVQCLIKF